MVFKIILGAFPLRPVLRGTSPEGGGGMTYVRIQHCGICSSIKYGVISAALKQVENCRLHLPLS
jgi:hypothetical protein